MVECLVMHGLCNECVQWQLQAADANMCQTVKRSYLFVTRFCVQELQWQVQAAEAKSGESEERVAALEAQLQVIFTSLM